MAVSATPVTLTNAGAPVTSTVGGAPVTLVGGTTIAAVSDGQALVVPVTGTYTTTATLTVAGGVVTGIVLS